MKTTTEKPVFFIGGATGTGKSSAAIILATALRERAHYHNVVIVNCDVMQFYQDLPIATNKASKAESSGIPHVFMGFLEADDQLAFLPEKDYFGQHSRRADDATKSTRAHLPSFAIHTYVDRVAQFIESYFSTYKDAAVVICGGTCYYLQALLFDNTLIDDCGPEGAHESDSDTNESNESRTAWEQLNVIDPKVAQRYHPNDTRRVRRMLEIYRRNGKLPSAMYAEQVTKLRFSPEQTFMVWTSAPRETQNLYISKRVDEMVERGLVKEVLEFHSRCGQSEPTGALKGAIGFREFVGHFSTELLQPGSEKLAFILESIRSHTRQYARKQERWIKNRIIPMLQRSQPPLLPSHFVQVDLTSSSNPQKAVQDILSGFLHPQSTPPGTDAVFPLQKPIVDNVPITQEWCSACSIVVHGREQMKLHVQSKRHRGALKRQKLEKDQLEKYGRILPPSKRFRST